MIKTSAFRVAKTFIGIREIKGSVDNPQILAMLKLDTDWPSNDEIPWCSAFVNYIAKLLDLERSKSLRARSWLEIGMSIPIESAIIGEDVVIIKRGKGQQPGPENMTAIGHVGFYAGQDEHLIYLLGGNQSDSVSIAAYNKVHVLGVRRLHQLNPV